MIRWSGKTDWIHWITVNDCSWITMKHIKTPADWCFYDIFKVGDTSEKFTCRHEQLMKNEKGSYALPQEPFQRYKRDKSFKITGQYYILSSMFHNMCK